MLIVWWILWLYPALAVAPDLATCSKKWVRMTDRNYQRAIKHYADCVLLGQALDPPAREVYQSNIVINLQKTCDYFFQRTSLPTSGLIGVVREVAKILEGFELEPSMAGNVKNKLSWSTLMAQCKSVHTTDYDSCSDPTLSTEVCEDENQTHSNQTPSCETPSNETPSSLSGYSSCSLFCMLFVFLLLFIIQIIFIIWVCCCNNCICLELCKGEGSSLYGSDGSYENLPAPEVYHMTEIQQDLASLSSENIGSDSEFEALLKMKKLPKTNRQWYSKEAD